MPVDLENSSTASGEASVSFSSKKKAPPKTTIKKKRSLPGTPDPDAEVIALSPKTLLATNRFVCEICNKGFQRDQNLQLHRRGHNLPWKLRQRSSKEVKKRVYVCPETSCVHHEPSRALGDLTGIKKHFCRKHGEKKWKCEKCSKKYAVQSDFKAHAKVCGTKEYKCDCGSKFSRRDSFITHRAFCDMLTKEGARAPPNQDEGLVDTDSDSDPKVQPVDLSSPNPPPAAAPAPAPAAPPPAVPQASDAISSSVSPVQTRDAEMAENSPQVVEEAAPTAGLNGSCSSSSSSSSGCKSNTVFASLFASSTASGTFKPSQTLALDLMRAMARPDLPTDGASSSSMEPFALCLATAGSSIFGTSGQERRQYGTQCQAAMSATALLQKAAQMGATTSNSSLLCGLGLVTSSSSSAQQDRVPWGNNRPIDSENATVPAGLGLGLHCDGSSGLKELIMGTPSVFGPKQPTLDFLGLGMAASGATPSNGISTHKGGGRDMAATAAPFEGKGGEEIAGNDASSSS